MSTPPDAHIGERLGIIAGSGLLPFDVAMAARASGENPFILTLQNETDQDWSQFDSATVHIGDFAALKLHISRQKIDRVIMAGSVKQRPQLSQIRPTFNTLLSVPKIIRNLVSGGDDQLLRSVIELIEAQGCRVVGAHEVVPDLLAEIGAVGDVDLTKEDWLDMHAAQEAANQLGSLDIGQGAVAVGGRVIALEGLEGTDQMLQRVAHLRADGRLPKGKKGVLVKICKPKQDMRADLPTIGLLTVDRAIEAGLSAIVVDAGRSFILERDHVIARANANGISIYGQERRS